VISDVGRLKHLDGLRALAVLAVVACHSVVYSVWAESALGAPEHPTANFWFATLALNGAHGVDLFFVLSGFCLSYPVLSRLRPDGNTTFALDDFFARRLVRIVPPFYAAILVTFAGLWAAGHLGLVLPNSMKAPTGPFDILRAMLFLDRGTYLTNGSFWSLFVELRWYLFFPLVLELYVRSPRAFVALGVACVIAYNFTSLRAIDLAVLPAFMLGIVAADWQLVDRRLAKYALILAAASFDLALVLGPYSSMPSRFGTADEFTIGQQTNLGWQLASFFLVVSVGRFRALTRVFELAPLRAIGVASYAIYLVHQPLVNLWTDTIAPHAGAAESFCGAVAFGVSGGFIFWFLAERPFLRQPLRRRMVDALREPIARALAFGGVSLRLSLGSRHQRSIEGPPIARDLHIPVPATTSS
jgi:peptidoglycan/LPS O-acetylase OafA/YrhL